jgi:hypothetical protein
MESDKATVLSLVNAGWRGSIQMAKANHLWFLPGSGVIVLRIQNARRQVALVYIFVERFYLNVTEILTATLLRHI